MQSDGRLVSAGRLAAPRYRGLADAARQIVAAEGVGGLWRGVGPAVQRAGLVNLGEYVFKYLFIIMSFFSMLWPHTQGISKPGTVVFDAHVIPFFLAFSLLLTPSFPHALIGPGWRPTTRRSGLCSPLAWWLITRLRMPPPPSARALWPLWYAARPRRMRHGVVTLGRRFN